MGEITVILLLALIFLGPSKLPDLAAGLGKLIKEIRKATSDVKNEIALDDTFRKPFEELRDAVTLHPDELKRRDQWAKERDEAAKRAAEEAAKLEAESASGQPHMPPDGLADHVKLEDVQKPEAPAAPRLPEPNGPNATIVEPIRTATLDDVPTPPPADALAAKPPEPPKPSLFATPGAPPAGTVPRTETARGLKPVTPATPAAPPVADASNKTQILKEEDLIPSTTSGSPPPPPHLPGLRPAGAPRPTPPFLSTPSDKKKS
jgi:sec-independent protein translocase protein TatB